MSDLSLRGCMNNSKKIHNSSKDKAEMLFHHQIKEFISKCFSALMRDRDELAAALEVRDRIKYDLSTPERVRVVLPTQH